MFGSMLIILNTRTAGQSMLSLGGAWSIGTRPTSFICNPNNRLLSLTSKTYGRKQQTGGFSNRGGQRAGRRQKQRNGNKINNCFDSDCSFGRDLRLGAP